MAKIKTEDQIMREVDTVGLSYHGDGWVSSKEYEYDYDTNESYSYVYTYYECDGCGAPTNGPNSYCSSCGRNGREW